MQAEKGVHCVGVRGCGHAGCLHRQEGGRAGRDIFSSEEGLVGFDWVFLCLAFCWFFFSFRKVKAFKGVNTFLAKK